MAAVPLMPPILRQLQVNYSNAPATTEANTMAVTVATAGRDAVAVPLTVHGAGWQPSKEMALGLLATLMLNVRRVLLLAVRTVGRDRVRRVDVAAKGKIFG